MTDDPTRPLGSLDDHPFIGPDRDNPDAPMFTPSAGPYRRDIGNPITEQKQAVTQTVAVTDEMAAVGEEVFTWLRGTPGRLSHVYRAMAAVAPRDDIVVLRGWVAAMTEQRDAALARAEAAEKERDAFRTSLCTTVGKLLVAHTECLSLRARLAQLEPPEPTPPNPYRAFPVERRRVGG